MIKKMAFPADTSFSEFIAPNANLPSDRVQGKQRVLVVDDEPSILRILGIRLQISGYEVTTAAGGQEALRLVESYRPDIMLLDIIMPGMGGLEVLQRLRTFSQLPVIAFSAKAEYASQALSLGANHFVSKPFDPDEMITKIQGLLDR